MSARVRLMCWYWGFRASCLRRKVHRKIERKMLRRNARGW